jgi:cysteine-rich CWC protein
MVLSSMNAQTCESCGREFGCGAQDKECWCATLTLSADRLAILREHFERCLCPDCLRLAAATHDPSRSADGRSGR